MSDVNELIVKKLTKYPKDIAELAINAIKLSQSGLSEISVAEQLGHIAKKIIKNKGA